MTLPQVEIEAYENFAEWTFLLRVELGRKRFWKRCDVFWWFFWWCTNDFIVGFMTSLLVFPETFPSQCKPSPIHLEDGFWNCQPIKVPKIKWFSRLSCIAKPSTQSYGDCLVMLNKKLSSELTMVACQGPGHALLNDPLGSGWPSLPHRGVHRQPLLHRLRVSRGHPGRWGRRNIR